jgi:hypothetical protein
MSSANITVLDRIVESLRSASDHNTHDLNAPLATMWTDGNCEWTGVIDSIAKAVPELLVLDGDSKNDYAGTSTQLRYQMNKIGSETHPIIYLPGVNRQSFRSITGFPESARHLYALQFQSAIWTQKNGKDWTPQAFLGSSDGGLKLDISGDKKTTDALADQLNHVLKSSVVDLSRGRLEAKDFHDLALGDPIRTMLQWISSDGASKQDMDSESWTAFSSISKQQFEIDPDKDGIISAATKLTEATGKWNAVWTRYNEAYLSYPGVRERLALVHPKDMFDDNPRIPENNVRQEGQLRDELIALSDLSRIAATERLDQLCNKHIVRAESLFAELGEAPLAQATAHLREMIDGIQDGIGGSDWDAIATNYIDHAWRIDSSAWKSMACAVTAQDSNALSGVLSAVYVPWLEKLADRVTMIAETYPNKGPDDARVLPSDSGTAVLFVDGLRADLIVELKSSLARDGYDTMLEVSWAALPSITATSKPAWNPLAQHLNGATIEDGMEPRVAEGGGKARSDVVRKLTAEAGWKYLDNNSIEGSDGVAWTEIGTIDHNGHDTQTDLAAQLSSELEKINRRVSDLLNNGWSKVVVVTDHGFLYAPGGLPSVELPKHLTESKWGRCALPKPGAQHNFTETDWFWGGGHSVVLAPGISVFRNGLEYSHGGLTLQECLTPILTVTPTTNGQFAQLSKNSWVGMRCRVETTGVISGYSVDIRMTPMDSESSMSTGLKVLDEQGKASLVVIDDINEGKDAYIVLIDDNGSVVSQLATTVGKQ